MDKQLYVRNPAILPKTATRTTSRDDFTGGGVQTGRPCSGVGPQGAVKQCSPDLGMKTKIPAPPKVAKIEAAAEERDTAYYVLRLYVTGTTRHSMRAIVNVRKFCEEHLHGRHELEIVDISKKLSLAADEQILAAPTLIKKLPLPVRRFIGDMSQTEKILIGLDLRKTPLLHPHESTAHE